MRCLFMIFCLIAAVGARADWSDWFTPFFHNANKLVSGTISMKDGDVLFIYDPVEEKFTFDKDFMSLLNNASAAVALEALEKALKNDSRLKSLAENLEALFYTTGFNITDSKGKSYNIKMPGTLKDTLEKKAGVIKATTDKDIRDLSDNHFELSNTGFVFLKNYLNTIGATTLGTSLANGDQTHKIPRLSKNGPGQLEWIEIGQLNAPTSNTVDHVSISGTQDNELQIYGFDDVVVPEKLVIPGIDTGESHLSWLYFDDLFSELFEYNDNAQIDITGANSSEGGDVLGNINGSVGFNGILGILSETAQGECGKALFCDGEAVSWDTVVKGVQVYGEDLDSDESGIVNIDSLVTGVQVYGDDYLYPNEAGVVNIDSLVKSVTINGNTPALDANGNLNFGTIAAISNDVVVLADEKSIHLKPATDDDEMKYEINGWTDEVACSEDLLDLLNNGNVSHQILCRTANGVLHYLPITHNDLKMPLPSPADFDTTDSGRKFKIKPGAAGNYLKSTSDGTIWAPAISSIQSGDTDKLTVSTVDGVTTLTPVGGNIAVSGTQGAGGSGQSIRFESMPDSNVKIDVSTDTNGVIVIKLGVYYKQ